MIRVDFHIHTLSTGWDEDFEFDLNQLVDHVQDQSLDAIAITNHNVFDKPQFDEIARVLHGTCVVFPGVEVSALGSHILLICPIEEADALEEATANLKHYLPNVQSSCTYEEVVQIFPNIKNWIVIPHYQKEPSIPDEQLKKIEDFVSALETSSVGKALRLKKAGAIKPSPVYFTDYRFGCENNDDLKQRYRPGSIYLRTNNADYSSIINQFKLGHIQLNKWDNEDLEIIPGIAVQKGINLLIGKRSTGKSVTLDKASKLFDSEDVYYIKQGDLVDESKEDDFYKSLNSKFSDIGKEYKKHWNNLFSTLANIGSYASLVDDLKKYLDGLKAYANTQTTQDAYAKCHLFRRREIEEPDVDEAENLIPNVLSLLKAEKYSHEIQELLGRDKIIQLLKMLVKAARSSQFNRICIQEANKITEAVKKKLSISSVSPYPDQPIPQIAMKIAFHTRGSKLLEKCWNQKIVYCDNGRYFGKYTIVAKRKKFTSADDVKSAIGTTSALGRITTKDAQDYLDILIGEFLISGEDAYLGLFDVEVSIQDSKGASPSGGQRTECVFLGKLEEASGRRLILIDEPESSFDNPFLNEEISTRLKAIGENAIVVVSTHNPVLGFSVNPQRILITDYDETTSQYVIYEGSLSDQDLIGTNSGTVPTRDSMLHIFEAGKDSHDFRNKYYKGE